MVIKANSHTKRVSKRGSKKAEWYIIIECIVSSLYGACRAPGLKLVVGCWLGLVFLVWWLGVGGGQLGRVVVG